MKNPLIGRGQRAQIILNNSDAVARVHAELTIDHTSRLYLTDCNSTNGTFIYKDGSWQQHSQGYVQADDWLRFADVKIHVQDLLALIPADKVIKKMIN
ncbi:MAG: FHA domain-containing protein, partial [Mariprofundales bacterium]